jgi:uncharacterized protein with HEPN domain
MRPRRTYVDYLRDILDHAQKAERFTAGIDAQAFYADSDRAESRALHEQTVSQ